MLAASAGNDALQAGFSWLCARANEQSATADAQRVALASVDAAARRLKPLGSAARGGYSYAAMRAHSLTPPRASVGGPFRATPSPVRLSLPARARNIAVVRRALEAIAEELALPRRLVEDMRLAVTEACTNVVRHAYSGEEADEQNALRVELRPQPRGMLVDRRGPRSRPRPQPRRARARPRAAADRRADATDSRSLTAPTTGAAGSRCRSRRSIEAA